LSLLDQGIAFGGGKIEGASIATMLGSIDRGHVQRMLEALARQDGTALLDAIDLLDERAPDYGAVLDELLEALQHIAVLQLVGHRSEDEDLAALAPLAKELGAEDAQLYYQIALNGRRDLPICRDPHMGFAMTMLRMLAFRPGGEAATVGAAPAARRSAVAGATPPPAASAAPSSLAAAATNERTRPAGNAVAADKSPPEDWATVLQALDLRGPARQLADNCDLKSNAGGAWQLVLPADKEHLNTQQLRARVERALQEQYGRELRLTITPGTPARPTPADARKASENERMREAREAIEGDPNVKAVQSAFDATLEPDSIRSTK
jgi:DNA polymerase-3 subunit gamma/tau